jgi:hypothetical protein
LLRGSSLLQPLHHLFYLFLDFRTVHVLDLSP